MRDAIKHIEPLASVDEARLTTCFLAPAVRALPNRFEHHGDDAARARDVFGVGAGECARLSTSARSIFMRAASSGANGEGLMQMMMEEGSSATLASACGKVWSAGGEEALRAIKATPFGAPKTLSDVQWEVVLPLTGSNQELMANLDLELSEQTPSGKPTRETFNCEFSHEALVDFFGKVETIQKQLDALM